MARDHRESERLLREGVAATACSLFSPAMLTTGHGMGAGIGAGLGAETMATRPAGQNQSIGTVSYFHSIFCPPFASPAE